MKHRSHLSSAERAARSQLAKLLRDRPLLCGSLVRMARTCGSPGCKCARGDKHVSLYLSTRVGGRRRMIYVPADWEERVTEWVRTYRRTKELTAQLSEACLERFMTQAKSKGKGTLRRAKGKSKARWGRKSS